MMHLSSASLAGGCGARKAAINETVPASVPWAGWAGVCLGALLAWALLGLSSDGLLAATLPPGFVLASVGGYWDNGPAGITFDETGVMYEWDRDGRVWIFEDDQRLEAPLVDLREEVGNWDDHGLLGFALDPNFRQNGYLYLLYVVDHHHLTKHGTPQYNPSANEYYRATIGRITRYTARASDNFRSVDPASRTVLLGESASSGFPILSLQHGVGSLVFGTDGTLLASCGDGTLPADYGNNPDTYYAQALSEGIIQPKENVGAFRAQLPDSLSGKVLRIDPATGDGVPGNPFYDPAHPRAPRSRVWALGLRNPFRMTLRPGTGSHSPAEANPGALCLGDVGYDTWEELDVVDGPGRNLGWPIFEGFSAGMDDGDADNLDAHNPLYGINGCDREYFGFRDLLREATVGAASWPNPCDPGQQVPAAIPRFSHTRPAIDWRHGTGPSRTGFISGTNVGVINVGAPGSPVAGPQFGGNCSIGGTWYVGADFPAQYQNTYFFADLGASWIRCMRFDSSNRPVSISDFATGADGIVALATHPLNGGLYFVNLWEGISKITYGGNAPPQAVASADVTYGPSPLAVTFAGHASSDPEGGPLRYQWNFGDGSPVSTNADPVHVFTAPAGVPTRYVATLTVTDSALATHAATVIVSVNNTPPQVTITSPRDGGAYPVTGDTVFALNAEVRDAEHADSQLVYQWQTILHHNNHEHPGAIDTNHATTAVTSPVGCDGNTYSYRMVLTVTDPAGLSGRAEVNLYPACSNTPPVLAGLADQTIATNTATAWLEFTVGDQETPAASLALTGASSHPALVPDGNILFGGTGSNRTVRVVPAADQSGTASITVTVNDGSLVATGAFVVRVKPRARVSVLEVDPDGMVRLRVEGLPQQPYEVQASADLRHWSAVGVVSDPTGVSVFTDVAPMPSHRRFYRVVEGR